MLSTSFLIATASSSETSLVDFLKQYYKAAFPQSLHVPTECKQDVSPLPDPITSPLLAEACDHYLDKYIIVDAHLRRDDGIKPEFYEVFELPPQACFWRDARRENQKDAIYSCLFDSLRESLKYEVFHFLKADCAPVGMSKERSRELWEKLSRVCQGAQSLSEWFGCFVRELPASDAVAEPQLREIARIAMELDLNSKTCELNVKPSKESPASSRPGCMEAEHFNLMETVMTSGEVLRHPDVLAAVQPGFAHEELPDYLFLFNKCDNMKLRKKRRFIPPNAMAQDLICKDPQTASPSPFKKGDGFSELTEALDALGKNKKESPTEVQAPDSKVKEAISRAFEKALAKRDLDLTERKDLKQKQADKDYVAAIEQHYLSEVKNPENIPQAILDEIERHLVSSLIGMLQGAREDAKAKERAAEEDRKKLEAFKASLKGPEPVPPPPEGPGPKLSSEEIQALGLGRKVRSFEELARIATATLANHKSRQKDIPPSWGECFIEAEIADEPASEENNQKFSQMLQEWAKVRKEYRLMIDSMSGTTRDKILAVAAMLDDNILWKYKKRNALMTDVLSGSGGNCEAETKFIISVLQELGLLSEQDPIVGVQRFSDHVQPVLFDKTKDTVMSLVSGKSVMGRKSPIYEPEILHFAYLEGHGLSSPTGAQELLIADTSPYWAKRLAGMRNPDTGTTNTKSKFPPASIPFSDGPIPESAVLGKFDLEGAKRGLVSKEDLGQKKDFISELSGKPDASGAFPSEQAALKAVGDVLRSPAYREYMELLANPGLLFERDYTSSTGRMKILQMKDKLVELGQYFGVRRCIGCSIPKPGLSRAQAQVVAKAYNADFIAHKNNYANFVQNLANKPYQFVDALDGMEKAMVLRGLFFPELLQPHYFSSTPVIIGPPASSSGSLPVPTPIPTPTPGTSWHDQPGVLAGVLAKLVDPTPQIINEAILEKITARALSGDVVFRERLQKQKKLPPLKREMPDGKIIGTPLRVEIEPIEDLDKKDNRLTPLETVETPPKPEKRPQGTGKKPGPLGYAGDEAGRHANGSDPISYQPRLNEATGKRPQKGHGDLDHGSKAQSEVVKSSKTYEASPQTYAGFIAFNALQYDSTSNVRPNKADYQKWTVGLSEALLADDKPNPWLESWFLTHSMYLNWARDPSNRVISIMGKVPNQEAIGPLPLDIAKLLVVYAERNKPDSDSRYRFAFDYPGGSLKRSEIISHRAIAEIKKQIRILEKK